MAPRRKRLASFHSGTDTLRSVFSMRLNKIKRALRGEVNLRTAAREALRRTHAATLSRRERASLNKERRLELKREFAEMSSGELLSHFQSKNPIRVFSGFDLSPSAVIPNVLDWRRDPRSGYERSLDYHRAIKLMRGDGSDIRVVWELNRLGHLLR